jgi:hypothetical protein
MQTISVIKGRITGPTSVELDEPVPAGMGEVEVWLKVSTTAPPAPAEDVFQFLRSIPPGTRTKDDIDAQLDDEPAEWEGR